MKALKTSTLVLFLLNQILCFSQEVKMTKEVEETIQLGKDSIVRLALKLIDDRADVKNFSKTKVMTNGEQVLVSFINPIKYLPKKTTLYFDVVINLLEKTASYNSISNPINGSDQKNIPFYKQTEEIKKNIDFVIESMNVSHEVDPITIVNSENDMIIRENKNYYDITVISEFQESSYKIEKISGKIYDAQHAHLEPPPTEKNTKNMFIEIKL
ncbi:hypothetical protein [Aquimarina sediminis]|uniref:hypothetical protein n=1 Tax=Aquimarina sediminis TaxID=2070536 RepID=UPI000CA05681|nr:hypothetical protein [Aquimarina sediminis]